MRRWRSNPSPSPSPNPHPTPNQAGKNFGPPGNKKLIYFVDDLNMAALDKYGTASNVSLMRQHMGYGHIYDLGKLSQKVLLNTHYLTP